MQHRRKPVRRLLINCFFLAAAVVPAMAQVNALPQELEGVGVEEKLGQQVNLNLEFTAENGYQVPLRKFFGAGKPVVLNLVYYRCPMLCNLVLNAQTKVMKQVAWTAGQEYDVVTVSIDPEEMFNLAVAKKKWYLEQYGREQAAQGWHFLTDYQGNAKRLADAVGFNYRWDAKGQQWAHAAAIMILTPDGKVSRYLYGLQYKERDMRLGLAEASEGKLGSVGDKLLLFCFHYDPVSRSYVPFARNLMKAGGALMIVVFGAILSILWRRERRKSLAALPDGVVTAK